MSQKDQILEIITEVWCFTETAEDFYDRLRKRVLEEVSDNGWISIKDRLPGYKEKILLVDADDRISTGYMLGENYWCVSICNKFTPIAWQPLPLPPSK